MKILLAVLALATVASATSVQQVPEYNTAYGYLTKFGIPQAEKIRQAEEKYDGHSRITGGVPSNLGQNPWQAGLLINLTGVEGTAVCGASLISGDRLVTAAHCWSDGLHQAWKYTVVLGSVTLFTGGERIDTSAVVPHPKWLPLLVLNDIAVIYLPKKIAFSATISPVGLSTGAELDETFVGATAVASGFGVTSHGGALSQNQSLSHVTLTVISNKICKYAFPLILRDTNICTRGFGGVGPCIGDSGGPLVVYRNNKPILIGVTSFGSALGCDFGLPTVFARVTSFNDFIVKHIS